MDNSVFDKARKWICYNARPIDRARFRYLFENGIPWWMYDDQSYDVITYNPTATLAGFALNFAGRGSVIYKRCYDIVREAIIYLKEAD